MKSPSLFLLSLLLLSVPIFAVKADDHTIVAVVNEEIISSLDIENRIRFIIGTAGLSDTPEVRAKLGPQVLRQLIDERLQLQEAARSGVEMTTEDVKAGIAGMEQQQHKEPGALETFIEQHSLPKLTFYAQLKAQLAWNRLITKKIQPKVRVSDDEVHKLREKQANNAGATEIQFSSILLPVDAPENDDSVKKLAEKLVSELQGGANFDAVASQLGSGGASQTLSARPDDLDPAVAKALASVKNGEIAPPVRTVDGYQILKRLGEHTANPVVAMPEDDAEVATKQILLSLKPDATNKEAGVLLDIARAVAKHPGACEDKTVAGIDDLKDVDISVSFTRTRLSLMSKELRTLLAPVGVGETTEPFATPKGLQLLMVCEKIDLPVEESEQNKALKEAIFSEKMSLEALKYMRNLRRDAFIEVRK